MLTQSPNKTDKDIKICAERLRQLMEVSPESHPGKTQREKSLYRLNMIRDHINSLHLRTRSNPKNNTTSTSSDVCYIFRLLIASCQELETQVSTLEFYNVRSIPTTQEYRMLDAFRELTFGLDDSLN